MRVTVGLVIRGGIAGLGLTGALAAIDALMHSGSRFGLQTGLIGMITGGIALGLALLMALTSYYLASRSRAPVLRKRLLAGAIWAGAAGMACGVSAIMLWLVSGRPWLI